MIPEARLCRLLAELVDDLGVPAGAAGTAIEMLRTGRPVLDAADVCLDAIDRGRLDDELLALLFDRAAATSPPLVDPPRRRRARALG